MATNERVVTGLSTIPAYQTKTGTFTTDTDIDTVLNFSGTTETPEDIFGANYQYKKNLYVFSIANEEVRLVTGVYPISAGSFNVQLESAFTADLAAEVAYIVEADLIAYSLVNQGSADGMYGGVAVSATVAINEDYSPQTPQKAAKVVDGTGTELLIIETK
jgi:hypothetical protein